MKKIIYLFVALFIIASTQSCKRLGDVDGDLLNNLDANQGGLIGSRFLYQEVNSVDTLAEYHYTGKKLVEVLNPKSKTKITYNGELINKLEFYEVVGADSLAYIQYYTYDSTAKFITSISEVGATYMAYKAVIPGAIVRYKAIHDFAYNTDKSLKTIRSRNGIDNPALAFEYTSYVLNTFTFNTAKTNVTKVTRDVGPYAAGAFGPSTAQDIYDFSDYDDKFNPQSLLPFGYKASALLDDTSKFYWLSLNNPKRVTLTTGVAPPVVTSYNTNYTYDPQNYALSGFGSNYDYRPF
ncbi:hypothetical protein [Frigoriflavimonas asaccharolytica]|uniref:Uncharacterized protein n=1 Tax=Frigoriflavimonas asaccharolytica TaxID=2735899 RepID=A0A8J8G6P1_9FLAO|nr:hypothetical protein [Frigoriflavimonas asaccharolytica]NRS92153.1 hypothetical protein [Frigoriflavimonas asaccharolytica]